MAQNVAGDAADVSSITKPGAEIHEYQPTPGDIKRAQGAKLILANGLNLELWFARFYQHLNGVQAMTYARIRKGGTGDDWGRVERQSIVLQAMFDTVQDKSATELIGMMPRLLPYVTTSLKKTEMAALAKGLFAHGRPTMEHTRVPADGEWNYGGSQEEYIVYDLDKAAQEINDFIYGDTASGQ